MSKKVLILSNHFVTLYNFRRELIAELIKANHEVYISMPKSEDNVYFTNLGCKVIETKVDRRGMNPILDALLLLKYIKIMIDIKPDIVLSYTIKPNIYGCIASKITGNKQISNITGTGATFLNDSYVSVMAKLLYRISLKRSYKVYFQNGGDRDYFKVNRIIGENYALLPGSGVNLDHYQISELPMEKGISFIFIGRVMKLKGIDEYLESAKFIKSKYPETNFYVAGFIEEDEYKEVIIKYHSQGIINYIGFQKDIRSWIEKCHCTILPSHGGEGVPNVLLETAAMGRVCIASNVNGSTDVVQDGVNGYLFKTGNAQDLSKKVEILLQLNIQQIRKMGLEGRKKVENEFNRNIIVNAYLNEIRMA